MEIRGKHLVLTSTGLDDAEVLLPVFNGDKQFNMWSGFPSDMTLDDVQRDMYETQQLPEGIVWRIDRIVESLDVENKQSDTLVGIAETALHPNPETGWIALLIIQQAFQGRGYGSEAASLLEQYLYSYPTVQRIGLGVLLKNLPAQRFWEGRSYTRGERKLDSMGHDCYEYHLTLQLMQR
jgi:RimJ/RimL family protein N-acetyltransferase